MNRALFLRLLKDQILPLVICNKFSYTSLTVMFIATRQLPVVNTDKSIVDID